MKVVFQETARKQLLKLDKAVRRRIVDYMAEVSELADPRSRGKALVGNLVGFWRYRVGDYRVLCRIKDKELVVSVVEIGHRSNVYD
ncbi:MAG: type II toxin-antitoxin system RelE/ParE family toxin [Treponema sp.]|nr:type II toxin-antitoxin system RelE/ParE family toxin [Treponema sp.]